METSRIGFTQDGEISRRARAKLNLFLHIVGRRADGFHLLESLVGFADVGDRVSARESDSLSLDIAGPFARGLRDTPSTENLVLRAAEHLAAATGHTRGAAIHLEKTLPVASGIGGGSADAAAALLALRDLWRAPLDDAALARIGLSLGADVPVCLTGTPALMSGVGEILTPVPPLPAAPLVLVNPGVPLPTPAVYKAFAAEHPTLAKARKPGPMGPWLDVDSMVGDLAQTANDLEAPALRLCPVISDTLAALRTADGCLFSRMSGSGATSYGFFVSGDHATRAASVISAAHPSWWVVASRLAS